MERKIGEIFKYNGEWYQAIDNTHGVMCSGCTFVNEYNDCEADISVVGNCGCKEDTPLIFKKLEKVGEPFTIGGNLFQHCKVFDIENVCGDAYSNVHNYNKKTVLIEIKQNKEDMEEKGQCGDNRFEIINKAKEALLKETNIARDKQEMAVIDNILFRCWQMGWLDKYDDTKHSNSENIGKNLKPFNLEAAKAGKPVCTRDGRKARIICFDAKGDKPIIALVEYKGNHFFEKVDKYFINGHSVFEVRETDDDLMMLSEKKEGWINVYKTNAGNIILSKNPYKTYKEAFDNRTNNYIDTVKITWEE